MSDQMNFEMDRRDFLKGVAAVGVGAAAAGAMGNLALPEMAWADAALADGTYKVRANLYISKSLVLIKKDAYFTNPTDPNLGNGIPDSPTAEKNATLVVSGGVATVTVPLVNECFMLISATNGPKITIAGTQTKTATYEDINGQFPTRITEITFRLGDMGGLYELGACREYAAYQNPPFPMSLLVPGYLTWPATLKVDFAGAVAQ